MAHGHGLFSKPDEVRSFERQQRGEGMTRRNATMFELGRGGAALFSDYLTDAPAGSRDSPELLRALEQQEMFQDIDFQSRDEVLGLATRFAQAGDIEEANIIRAMAPDLDLSEKGAWKDVSVTVVNDAGEHSTATKKVWQWRSADGAYHQEDGPTVKTERLQKPDAEKDPTKPGTQRVSRRFSPIVMDKAMNLTIRTMLSDRPEVAKTILAAGIDDMDPLIGEIARIADLFSEFEDQNYLDTFYREDKILGNTDAIKRWDVAKVTTEKENIVKAIDLFIQSGGFTDAITPGYFGIRSADIGVDAFPSLKELEIAKQERAIQGEASKQFVSFKDGFMPGNASDQTPREFRLDRLTTPQAQAIFEQGLDNSQMRKMIEDQGWIFSNAESLADHQDMWNLMRETDTNQAFVKKYLSMGTDISNIARNNIIADLIRDAKDEGRITDWLNMQKMSFYLGRIMGHTNVPPITPKESARKTGKVTLQLQKALNQNPAAQFEGESRDELLRKYLFTQ